MNRKMRNDMKNDYENMKILTKILFLKTAKCYDFCV